MATKLIIVSTKAGVTADYTNLNSAMAAVDGGTYFASGVFTALSSSDDITIRVVETADCGGNTTLSFGSTKPNSVLIEGSTICQNGDLSTLAKVTATANTTFNFGSGRPLNGEWVFRNLYIDLNGFRHAGSNAVVTATGSGATLTGSNLVVEGSRSNQLGYGFKSDTRNPSLTMNLYNCVVTDCATTAGDFIGFGAAGSNGNVRGNFYQCLVVGLSASGTAYGFRNANTNAGSSITATNCVSYGTDVDYGTPVSGTSTFTNCGSEDGTGTWGSLVPASEFTAYATPIQDVTLQSNAASGLLGIQNAPSGSSDNLLTLDINNQNRRTTSSSGDPFKWSLGPWDALANSNPTPDPFELVGTFYIATSSGATVQQETPADDHAAAGSGDLELSGAGTASSLTPHMAAGTGELELSGTGVASAFRPPESHAATGSGDLELSGAGQAVGPVECGPYNAPGGSEYTDPQGETYSPICDNPVLLASGSGSLNLSGSGSLAAGRRVSGSGSVELTGAAGAELREKWDAAGHGSVVLAGAGGVDRGALMSGSGSIQLSGLASTSRLAAASGSGSLTLDGHASITVSGRTFTGGLGSLALAGSGSVERIRTTTCFSATWLIPTSFQTDVLQGNAFDLLGSGGIRLSGSANVKRKTNISGLGSVNLSGEATVLLPPLSGSGAVTLSGLGYLSKGNFQQPVGCRLIHVDCETRSFEVYKPKRQFNVDCLC